MKKETQAQCNPFPNTDSNKRYYAFDYYLRKTFGGKCAKIPLNAGFTCPNIDGRCGTGGCIYCSSSGSGDFTALPDLPISQQYLEIRERMKHKWRVDRCIPYFQAHTNTYAPLSVLRPLFEEALSLPDAVGLNIATRADCLSDDILSYLALLSEKTHLTIELGLQSIHDSTAERINRGHTYAVFRDTYDRIREKAPKIRIGIHLIFGLIGETREMMEQTVRTVAALHPDEVKIHLQYVLKGTVLGDLFESGEYAALSMEEYTDMVVFALEHLPPDTVIGRLTGDGEEKSLLAPLWSRKKLCVMNEIDRKMYIRNTFQGKYF